jgi:hypothetical protein
VREGRGVNQAEDSRQWKLRRYRSHCCMEALSQHHVCLVRKALHGEVYRCSNSQVHCKTMTLTATATSVVLRSFAALHGIVALDLHPQHRMHATFGFVL